MRHALRFIALVVVALIAVGWGTLSLVGALGNMGRVGELLRDDQWGVIAMFVVIALVLVLVWPGDRNRADDPVADIEAWHKRAETVLNQIDPSWVARLHTGYQEAGADTPGRTTRGSRSTAAVSPSPSRRAASTRTTIWGSISNGSTSS